VLGKVVIVGVGLIGGSFALALKRAGVVREVVGVGRGETNLQRAIALGIIDSIGREPAAIYGDADLVFLATPVGQMAAIMQTIAPHLGAHTVVTDGGSTKQDVVGFAQAHLPQHIERFVAAHPIAGAELSGVEAARADLYDGKKLIIATPPRTAQNAVIQVSRAWEACGMRIFSMSPAEHDAIFAAVSHFPHLMAFALVDDIASRPNAEELFRYAASGFRDSTRIAGSHPEMWRDIMLANREAVLKEIDSYEANLARLKRALQNHDGETLYRAFQHSHDARAAWIAAIEAGARGPGA
jgi:prephenate dehydrogenase